MQTIAQQLQPPAPRGSYGATQFLGRARSRRPAATALGSLPGTCSGFRSAFRRPAQPGQRSFSSGDSRRPPRWRAEHRGRSFEGRPLPRGSLCRRFFRIAASHWRALGTKQDQCCARAYRALDHASCHLSAPCLDRGSSRQHGCHRRCRGTPPGRRQSRGRRHGSEGTDGALSRNALAPFVSHGCRRREFG